MARQVSLDELVPSLLADIEKMGQEAVTKAASIVRQTSEEMKADAVLNAPVSKGSGNHLRDALTITSVDEDQGLMVRYYVSATKWHKYSIVHLLELGHLKPYAKGFVQAKPFMKPALDKYRPILDQRIDEMLSQLKGD